MVFAGNLVAGRYQLDEPIGTGWFSQVWRATDTALSRPIAVKLLHPAYARQPEALARFRAEGLHGAALWHENIAHIYDYDEPAEGPQPYLVMELVDGPSLAGVLADGSVNAERTMDIVAQAAAGLQAAHAKGLVHRDIRPGNLLLASSGTLKITDWGISAAIDSAPSPVTGIVTGTAEYLPPERIAGGQAAPAGDLYALGVVAYECLAGAPPFVGEQADVACAHRDHPVPPLPGWVPADVSSLVMQLVAKDPARRPGSAADVARQAGRLRHDPRDDSSVDAGRPPFALAIAAAVQPPAPVMAPAAVAAETRRQVPGVSRPAAFQARTDKRRLHRKLVLVLASVTIAGLIGMVLAVTVGAASVQHLASAPPSARPGHPSGATAAGAPARQPSSARPSHTARPGTSPRDTATVPVVVSNNHRTTTGSTGRRESIGRHRDRSAAAQRDGNGSHRGHAPGNGHGDRNGHGHGNGNGNGHGNGNANGHGNGGGDGNGQGNGNDQGGGNAQVLSISA